mgnify:CR=1 FL=1
MNNSEIIKEISAIDIAEKHYNKFCDELITALTNIAGFYQGLSYEEILANDINGGIKAMAKEEAYKEIAARITKERYLQLPSHSMPIDDDYINIRVMVDEAIGKIIPINKVKGSYKNYQEVQRLSQELSKFLSSKLVDAYERGYEKAKKE